MGRSEAWIRPDQFGKKDHDDGSNGWPRIRGHPSYHHNHNGDDGYIVKVKDDLRVDISHIVGIECAGDSCDGATQTQGDCFISGRVYSH